MSAKWIPPRQVDQLPPARRMAHMRRMLRHAFGKEQTDQMWTKIDPVVRDAAGHGDRTPKKIVGDADDPSENYWQGVWQIYEAD